ncbi:efflux RND transporter periplasmic adaptor subunit [Coraliomargarita parva]|uniref:efflux RND transporter periplasmic adaptor subunit n=1 Tax=Coraliomargarita parva TaxID=3014050 RepID=UPI0022B4E2DA|nr:efflux RND transporter periplasmic adaptor subunit [Coraliomargarita parva]
MLKKYLIPVLALAGFALVLFEITNQHQPDETVQQNTPKQTPFPDGLAGTGIVEASSGDIAIGTQVSGIISEVYVERGSEVQQGDPLFKIDDQMFQAELATRRAEKAAAEATRDEANYELGLAEALHAKSIISDEDYRKRLYTTKHAEAEVARATATEKAAEVTLQRATIRAPCDGQVLQINIHPGEFADSSSNTAGSTPLIRFGSVHPLYLRVDVDEYDAWRLKSDTPAIAQLRGHPEIQAKLHFVRIEPYLVPKKTLTGNSTERIDTRVVQAIYSFDRGELPIYLGQEMDVSIDTSTAGQLTD